MNPLLIPLVFKLIDFAFFAAEMHLDVSEVRGLLKVLQEKGEQITPEDMAALDAVIDEKLGVLREFSERTDPYIGINGDTS